MNLPPEYGTVGAEAYRNLGFRSGLEIHQQLLTTKKLFCRCPAGRYSDEYDAEILRHMRPTLSELGEYDGTALMEFKTRKEIIYRLNRETVCTYEMDDAPPFDINEEAVDIAIEIALLLKLQMVDELHIARKQYLDGSIPTGFQRTTILGVNGSLDYGDRRIGIRQLGLEEDACREISDVGHVRTYIADRLGMPLIEVVTEPQMQTPGEVEEVGQLIRQLTRCTGKVRRGIGAARQDVNVSITGGTRVEIKGVPRLPMIPALVHYEAYRQKALLDIRDELRRRGLTPEGIAFRQADVTRWVTNTPFVPVAETAGRGQQVRAVRLPKFQGLLSTQTQPHTDFLQEFADRVRVVACLQGRPNLVASGSSHQSLTPGEWERVRREVEAGADDAVIVVWGDEADVRTAASEIEIRAVEALRGIPNETRQAFHGGTNGFERILPGPDRMYPDTDLPPKAVGRERVERIRAILPEIPSDRKARLAGMGLSKELVDAMLRSGRADLFDRVAREVPESNVRLTAYVLGCHLTRLQRRGLAVQTLSGRFFMDLFRLAGTRGWPREVVVDLVNRAAGASRPLRCDELIDLAPRPLKATELRSCVEESIATAPFVNRHPAAPAHEIMARRERCLMGALMQSYRGQVVGELLRRTLGQIVTTEVGHEVGRS